MSIKGTAQFSYADGGGTIVYGVANGRRLTFYLDQYGHLGPQRFVAGIPASRPPGIVDPDSGYPDDNISTDGLIIGNTTYCLLRSLDDRSVQPDMITAIKGKRELAGAGAGAVCATWGVDGDHADFHPIGGQGLAGIDGIPGAIAISGTDSDDPLSLSNSVTLYDQTPDPLLLVAQEFSFQNDSSDLEQVRIKVEVTLTNLLGGTLTGVYYGFGIDPNPGITTGNTTSSFLTPTDPEAFAVQGTSGDWLVGLGVYEVEGTILGYTTEIQESVLPRTFDTQIAGIANPTIRLGAGTNATEYLGTVLQASTTNWKTDAAWQAGLPSASGAYAIYVRSPLFDIASGTPETFTFYIFTRPVLDASAPAAGTRVWAYA
jgi:hypothetical protein